MTFVTIMQSRFFDADQSRHVTYMVSGVTVRWQMWTYQFYSVNLHMPIEMFSLHVQEKLGQFWKDFYTFRDRQEDGGTKNSSKIEAVEAFWYKL